MFIVRDRGPIYHIRWIDLENLSNNLYFLEVNFKKCRCKNATLVVNRLKLYTDLPVTLVAAAQTTTQFGMRKVTVNFYAAVVAQRVVNKHDYTCQTFGSGKYESFAFVYYFVSVFKRTTYYAMRTFCLQLECMSVFGRKISAIKLLSGRKQRKTLTLCWTYRLDLHWCNSWEKNGRELF